MARDVIENAHDKLCKKCSIIFKVTISEEVLELLNLKVPVVLLVLYLELSTKEPFR